MDVGLNIFPNIAEKKATQKTPLVPTNIWRKASLYAQPFEP